MDQIDNFKYQTDFKQSPFTPKPIIFKIVWTIIILLYCIALFKCFSRNILIHSIIIFLLCFIWVRLFFVNKNPKKALIIIVLLVFAVLLVAKKFYDVEPKYGKMQLVFIGWLFIATYFNYFVVMNN